MKMYIVSLAAGVLVGLIYGFLNVRSPAPPIIALVGLLGILVGEQLPPLIRQLWQQDQSRVSWTLTDRSWFSKALPNMLSVKNPSSMRGKSVRTSIWRAMGRSR